VSITVAIVEDNAGICEELRQIVSNAPDLSCVCVCRNAQTALRKIPDCRPDVVIMDIQLPDSSGIECTARLKPRLPNTQILMFTIYDDNEQIFAALKAGAVGYLLKDSKPEELLDAIRETANGGAPMTAEIARKVISSFHRTPAQIDEFEQLTRREDEILEHFSRGLLCKEIAARLGISLETVNSHRKNIYRKLHVRSRTEAVIKYLH
jgi:DNA-binding NarL/FixJ family response regulator